MAAIAAQRNGAKPKDDTLDNPRNTRLTSNMRQRKAKLVPTNPELIAIVEENELPVLTDQEFDFLKRVVGGQPAVKAYIDTHAVHRLSQRDIYYRCTALRNNPRMRKWITAIRCADIDAQFYTREQHLAALEEIKQVALKQGVPGAAVQCEISRGKVMGFYEDTLRVKTEGDDVHALIAQLREQLGPDVANAFAAKLIGKPHEDKDSDAA